MGFKANIGKMENQMETTIMENQMETPIMENQMEKKMENEMETGIILGLYIGVSYRVTCFKGPQKEVSRLVT